MHDPPSAPANPASHSQSVTLVLSGGEIAFEGQFVHERDPTELLYVDSAHPEQGPPSSPVNPALHLQSVSSSLPGKDCENCGHPSHAPDPMASLYVPASQEMHVAPSAPVAPALHLQSVMNDDLEIESERAGHSWQLGLPGGDHLPAEQSWHTSIPEAATEAE